MSKEGPATIQLSVWLIEGIAPQTGGYIRIDMEVDEITLSSQAHRFLAHPQPRRQLCDRRNRHPCFISHTAVYPVRCQRSISGVIEPQIQGFVGYDTPQSGFRPSFYTTKLLKKSDLTSGLVLAYTHPGTAYCLRPI